MQYSPLGFQEVKVVALAAKDLARANAFYRDTLGLEPAVENGVVIGYTLGQAILMPKDGWYASPTDMPNPRITLTCDSAPETEKALRERGVVIADPVETYDEAYLIGSFLDSEGNKLWFCSDK